MKMSRRKAMRISGVTLAGMSIIMISDEISEVYFNCDRVLHMRAGEIVGEYLPASTSEETIAEAVYA